ncbi:MAG: hypothetical protein MI757_08950, partial [Pirellulales bacterium]|nr:hypothetical protein [Pirellulales bacterium]
MSLAVRVVIGASAIAIGTAVFADDSQRAERDAYNDAVGLYRDGDIEQARALFQQATSSTDRNVEARARFNLANCDYAEAVALAEDDRPAAIAKLESAIAHYRSSLSVDRHDSDARANIELARLLMDRLRREEEQQQQEKQQKNDQQQNEQDYQGDSKDEEQNDQKSQDEKQESQQQNENNS